MYRMLGKCYTFPVYLKVLNFVYFRKLPLTILYGYEFPQMEQYINKFLPNVSYQEVKMKDPYGTHHS